MRTWHVFSVETKRKKEKENLDPGVDTGFGVKEWGPISGVDILQGSMSGVEARKPVFLFLRNLNTQVLKEKTE